MDHTLQQLIEAWLKKNPLVFRHRWEGKVLTLLENASGKALSFDVTQIVNHRLTPHPQGFKDYLNLVFEDGREIVLCHAGIAFAPSFISTGPLSDAPATSCISDYKTLFNILNEMIPDSSRRNEALLLFNVLISLLDGAKKIGFDVQIEEDLLEKQLSFFEKNTNQTT